MTSGSSVFCSCLSLLLLPLGWRRRSRVFGSLMLVSKIQYYFLVSLSLPPAASRWTEKMRDGGWSWWDKGLQARVTRIFLSQNQRKRLVMRAVSVECMWRRSPFGNKERERTGRHETTGQPSLVFLVVVGYAKRIRKEKSWRRRQELGKNQAYNLYASCVIDPFPEYSFPSLIFPLINLLLLLLLCFSSSSSCPQVSLFCSCSVSMQLKWPDFVCHIMLFCSLTFLTCTWQRLHLLKKRDSFFVLLLWFLRIYLKLNKKDFWCFAPLIFFENLNEHSNTHTAQYFLFHFYLLLVIFIPSFRLLVMNYTHTNILLSIIELLLQERGNEGRRWNQQEEA